MHRATLLVALEEFQAQSLEAFGFRVEVEGHRDHGLGAAGDHVADFLVLDGR
ncbi:hypothetical protein D3C72_2564260 [compost metagenome]